MRTSCATPLGDSTELRRKFSSPSGRPDAPKSYSRRPSGGPGGSHSNFSVALGDPTGLRTSCLPQQGRLNGSKSWKKWGRTASFTVSRVEPQIESGPPTAS